MAESTVIRGLSSNGAENWDRVPSLLDRPLRPPNDHGVFPRIIFYNHLFLRTFMHQQPQTTREALPYVIPLRRYESSVSRLLHMTFVIGLCGLLCTRAS